MRIACELIVAVVCCSAAWATPYYVEYQGSSGDFPEAEGWTRYTSGGGDVRYFEDGALVLDGQPGTHDAYAWYRPPGQLDPGPGEIFVAQWTLCVSRLDPPYPLDPSVVIYSDSGRRIGVDFGYASLRVDGVYIPFEPGVFHEYEIRSPDMLNFDLLVDGVGIYSGQSFPVPGEALVGWGDGALNAGSQSRWSTFSFGVIPEPCSSWLVLLVCLVRLRPRG